MNSQIETLTFPDFSGSLWYLNEINNSKLLYLSGIIKKLEWEFDVKRIISPHVREATVDTAHASYKHNDGSLSYYRLVSDMWKDSIEIAAERMLCSYKQLPYAISCEDVIYVPSMRYVWLVAVYGANINALATAAASLGRVTFRNEISKVPMRNQHNQIFFPEVAIMEVTLIEK